MSATKPQGSALFRPEALDAYLRGEPEGGIIRVASPRAVSLFWLLLAITTAGLVGSFVGRVEMSSRGRGIMRSVGGVRPVTTLIAGTVAEVLVRSGDPVLQGQTIVRLQSAGLRTELLEADRALALAKENLQRVDGDQQVAFEQRGGLLRSEADLLRRRMQSQDATIERLAARAQTQASLAEGGLVARQARDEAYEDLDQARRQRLAIEQSLIQNGLEVQTLETTHKTERWGREQTVQAAQSKRDALAFSLEQAEVPAPQSGIIEAVLVRAGDLVTPGTMLGKLLPGHQASQVVSFLSEKSRAFVEVGARVRIEVDQLPYSEFGSLTARIDRIAQDLASPYEVREAFGDSVGLPGPCYRVELTLLEDDALASLGPRLRPGMLVEARYSLRSRRIVTLVLDPLRRWWR